MIKQKPRILSLSTNFRLSGSKSQSQQTLAEKDDSIHNTVSLKKTSFI